MQFGSFFALKLAPKKGRLRKWGGGVIRAGKALWEMMQASTVEIRQSGRAMAVACSRNAPPRAVGRNCNSAVREGALWRGASPFLRKAALRRIAETLFFNCTLLTGTILYNK